MLTLRDDQIKILEAGLHRRSVRRIKEFLLRHWPSDKPILDETSLLDLVYESDRNAKEFGIRTEAGRGRWAYLMVLTDQKIAQDTAVQQMFARAGRNCGKINMICFGTITEAHILNMVVGLAISRNMSKKGSDPYFGLCVL